MAASFLALASMSLAPRSGSDVVAAVFPPWWSSGRIFAALAAADVGVVRTTALSSVLVVSAAGADDRQRLAAAGSLALIDPRLLAGCYEPEPLRN